MSVPAADASPAAETRILIVDDDGGTRRTLQLILDECGYQTDEAETGEAALKMLKVDGYDIVILDIKLPDAEGTDLIETMRDIQHDLITIMVTAYATVDSAVRALNAGASAYLLKPLNVDESLLVIKSLVERRRLLRQNKSLMAQIQISERMATVGTMAAGVAHEINNPLSVVMTNLDFLAEALEELVEDAPAARLRELNDVMVDSLEAAQRIATIVSGMRTFSRADEHNPIVVEVESVLEVAIKMSANEVRHRAQLVKEYALTPRIRVDETRLSQVFVNLIVNAAQAMDERSADRNEIRIIMKTGDAGQAVVEVRDNGPGICAENRSRVFDPFFTTKSVGQGTGLGLSISRRLVTVMNGTLVCDDVEGGGTVFRVTLPATAAAIGNGASPPKPSLVRRSTQGKVLVVDDERAVCDAVLRILRGEYEVEGVTSAAQALAHIEDGEDVAAIICDVMMPGMSGIDFYERLRRASPTHAERVIFITGGAFTATAQKFLDEVENPVLHKPLDTDALRTIVRSLVSVHR